MVRSIKLKMFAALLLRAMAQEQAEARTDMVKGRMKYERIPLSIAWR
jgi:hypothetical protein